MKSSTEWYLYFLECQASSNPKARFRDYEDFLDWLAEAHND
jgi:hypothetical protein